MGLNAALLEIVPELLHVLHTLDLVIVGVGSLEHEELANELKAVRREVRREMRSGATSKNVRVRFE